MSANRWLIVNLKTGRAIAAAPASAARAWVARQAQAIANRLGVRVSVGREGARENPGLTPVVGEVWTGKYDGGQKDKIVKLEPVLDPKYVWVYHRETGNRSPRMMLDEFLASHFPPATRRAEAAEVASAARRQANPKGREPSRVRARGTRVTSPASPTERIAALRQIVADKQYAKIDGKMADLFTASAILSVYDAINDANKAKLAAMPFPQQAMIAFRVLETRKNPSRSKSGRAYRRSTGYPSLKSRVGSRVGRAAVRAVRRAMDIGGEMPGNAAQSLYYLQHHEARSARRKHNPGAPTCYGQTIGRGNSGQVWVQEWYETASRDAAARAKQLRAAGWRVGTEAMGAQVTPVGVVKMTLLSAGGGDVDTLPPVRVEMQNPRACNGRRHNPGCPCDPRCCGAQGGVCECRCGGRNHKGGGGGYRTLFNPGRQTLREWSERHGIDMRQKGGAYWIPDSFTNEATRRELWALSDYGVSSVSGGTIWLFKRPQVNPKGQKVLFVDSRGGGHWIVEANESGRGKRNIIGSYPTHAAALAALAAMHASRKVNPRGHLPGSAIDLQAAGYIPCPTCGGAGITDPSFNLGPVCRTCKGEGWIKAPKGAEYAARARGARRAQGWEPNPAIPEAVRAYVCSIRNHEKQDYAALYALMLYEGRPLPAPPSTLSYLGAQAVRMRLAELIPTPGIGRRNPNPSGPLPRYIATNKNMQPGWWAIKDTHTGGNVWTGRSAKAARSIAEKYNREGEQHISGYANPSGGARIVHNRLLGGWFIVVGPHQTPISGRFDSKAEAQAWLSRPRGNPRRVVDWAAAELHAERMSSSELLGALHDIRKVLPLADARDRETGNMNDEGGYYRDMASVYQRERDRRAAPAPRRNPAEYALHGTLTGSISRLEDEAAKPPLALVRPLRAPRAPRAIKVKLPRFTPGDRVSVPYSGPLTVAGRMTRGKRDRGFVGGYEDRGGQTLVRVDVQRGKTKLETHYFPERMVRHARGARPRVADSMKHPRLTARFRREIGGDLAKARTMIEAEHAAYDQAMEAARAIYPQADDPGPHPEYLRLRAAMRNHKKRAGILEFIAGQLEREQYGPGESPWDVPAAAVGNPRHNDERARAERTFEMWHEFGSSRVKPVKVNSRQIPRHVVELGKVLRIDYESSKWQGKPVAYTHATNRPYPLLVTDPDGKQLYLVGGKMKPTADGLVN